VASVTERQQGLHLKVCAVTLTLQLFARPSGCCSSWTRSLVSGVGWQSAGRFIVIHGPHFYMGLLPLACSPPQDYIERTSSSRRIRGWLT
jgi:hypothetical protein